MGLPQRKVSELRRGRTSDQSVERLYRLLNNLGVGVAVVLEERPDWTKGEVAVREAEHDPADVDRESAFSMVR
jgi:transcriptional regulator with XRE-family HTH domain